MEQVKEVVGFSKLFWTALGVSILTNLIQAVALSYQRKSHLLNEEKPIEFQKKSYKRPSWIIGFICFIIANTIGSIFSIGYLPLVILAPIGAMNLVFNTFAAHIILKDPLTKQKLLGTGLICIGALLIGFYGVISEENHDISDLISLFKEFNFMIYFGLLEFMIFIIMIITHYLNYHLSRLELSNNEIYPIKSNHYSIVNLKKYIGISFGILSGIISSQSILFAKTSIGILISIVIDKNIEFLSLFSCLLIIMWILTGVTQLYYLNKGLLLCDTIILVPLTLCSFNLSCLFNGLVYYNQWNKFTNGQLFNVVLGVFITLIAVLLISNNNDNNDYDHDHETLDYDEDLYFIQELHSQSSLLVKKK